MARETIRIGGNARLRAFARARRRPIGSMTGYERAYAAELERMQAGGLIQGYLFEPIKLRLADRTWYSPDFLVIEADDTITLVEVKGHWEDDARVKVKVAAERFGLFRFVAVMPRPRRAGGGWTREEF